MVVPPKHPKMTIFSRKTHGCWVPPFLETPISMYVIGCNIAMTAPVVHTNLKVSLQPEWSLGSHGHLRAASLLSSLHNLLTNHAMVAPKKAAISQCCGKEVLLNLLMFLYHTKLIQTYITATTAAECKRKPSNILNNSSFCANSLWKQTMMNTDTSCLIGLWDLSTSQTSNIWKQQNDMRSVQPCDQQSCSGNQRDAQLTNNDTNSQNVGQDKTWI